MFAFILDSICPPAGIQKCFDGTFSSVIVLQKFADTLIKRGEVAGFSILKNILSSFSSISESAEVSVKLKAILFNTGVLWSELRLFHYKRRIAPIQIGEVSLISISLQIFSKVGTSVESPNIPINIANCQDTFL